VSISKKKSEPFSYINLEVTWSPDGNELLLSGDIMLRKMVRNKWEMLSVKEIGHKDKELNGIKFITEDCIATAGVDKIIKIWDYKNKNLKYYMMADQ
jgi:WD40 repeat protein